MPPLKNPRHEKLARQLVEPGTKSNTEAYQNVYGVSSATARASAPRVLANNSVRERVSELLDRGNLSLETLTGRLKDFVYSENEGIALKAVEDGFKLHGAFDEESKDVAIGTINIVFGSIVANPDAKEGHTEGASLPEGQSSDPKSKETDNHAS